MKQLTILVFALVAAIFSSCSNQAGTENEGNSATAESQKEMVKTIDLSYQEIERSVEYTATLVPFETVHLAPATPGKIENISVEVGDFVKKGQQLVKMNDAQLIQAEIQLANLKTDLNRMDTLKETGSIAKQQYDQLKTQVEVTQENVEYLRENTVIEAPFNGIVSGKYFESGEMYSGTPVATIGKSAILSVIQTNPLKAVVNISETYIPMIENGMKVSLKADVYPGKEFTGTIFRVHPTVDPQTRTFQTEVRVANNNQLLRPGMFCRMEIDLEKTEALVLPALAVLKMQGSNVRYLFVEKNGVAQRVIVKLGERFDDKVEIISDELTEGDHIIISGQERLLDQMEVEVAN
jgi:RND family efflux transporter MFP subunit